MSTGAEQVLLPQATPENPNLANGIKSATFPFADGKWITVRLPQAGQLIDDRYYNGPGYLLAFYPIAGEVAEGREWSYTVEIAIDDAPGPAEAGNPPHP